MGAPTDRRRTTWHRACPKCNGSVYSEPQLSNEVEYHCLQCGRTLTTSEVEQLVAVQRAREGVRSLRPRSDVAVAVALHPAYQKTA